MTYWTAWTKRSLPVDRFEERDMIRSGQPTTPLLHAISPSLPKASRTGANYRAVCGASVRYVKDVAFVAGLARSCRRCAKAVRP